MREETIRHSISTTSRRPSTSTGLVAEPISPSASVPAPSRFKSIFSPFKGRASPRVHMEEITLAEYNPTFNHRHRATILLYRAGVPYTFHLLLSLILLNSKKDEWKTIQSKTTAQELENVLNADLTGNLPMYTPVRAKSKGERPSTTATLHPTVSATNRWRWQNTGNDHDQVGNPLNLNAHSS